MSDSSIPHALCTIAPSPDAVIAFEMSAGDEVASMRRLGGEAGSASGGHVAQDDTDDNPPSTNAVRDLLGTASQNGCGYP